MREQCGGNTPRIGAAACSAHHPGGLQVRPGQSTLAFYTAENVSDKVITGVSTYNVAPMQAGTYFNKIQCFCFEVRRPGLWSAGLPPRLLPAARLQSYTDSRSWCGKS